MLVRICVWPRALKPVFLIIALVQLACLNWLVLVLHICLSMGCEETKGFHRNYTSTPLRKLATVFATNDEFRPWISMNET